MKKIQRLTALSLGVLSLATIGLSSCKKPDNGGSAVTIGDRDPMHTYNGTHIYTATETNEYLVKGGKTEYKLVIPASASKTLGIAQKEFSDLFKDATGINIEVKTDTEVTDASSGKYISLGRTKLLEDSGIEVNYSELTNGGHRVVTKGDDIYICGGKDHGTVFGVYSFMKVTFNYETYYYDCMEIDSVREKKLLKYDVKDIPDFKFRAHSSDVLAYNAPVEDYDANMFAWRLGYYGKEGQRGYYWLPVHEEIGNPNSPSGASTNANRWFPESIYRTEGLDTFHPDWYSDRGRGEEMQLCFSAHGKADEYEAMVNEAFEKVKWTLTYYQPGSYKTRPEAKIMSLTHMDNQNYCTCETCADIANSAGGSQAAVQILFMNDLAEKVDEWFEDPNCTGKAWKDDFQLIFFAYNHNYEAPSYYDAAEEKYVLYDEKFKVHPRVIAWFARNANGQEAFDDPIKNSTMKEPLERWAVVADDIYFWNYGTNFRSFAIPLDTFQFTTSEMFSFHCNISDKFWFTQYQDHNTCGNTAWHNLKNYLDAKMSWNTSLEQGELIEKWMNAMYEDAAPIMLKLFNSQRAYIRDTVIGEFQIFSAGDGSPPADREDVWPIGLVESWLAEMDDAKAAVERYKTKNPELYDLVCKHIEIEAISPLWMMLRLHSLTLSPQDKAMYIDRVRNDIEWLDISEMIFSSGTKNEKIGDFVSKYEK